jgi:hypothetical protein
MDFLHAQIVAIQNRLSFVQDDPTIDWRSCVLKLSWGICLFEIFLLCVLLVLLTLKKKLNSPPIKKKFTT